MTGPALPLTDLEIKSHLSGHCSRGYVVRSAERGEKVVESNTISEIDDCYLATPSVFVSVEQVVMPDRQIKQMPRSNAGGILIIIFRTWRRNLDQG